MPMHRILKDQEISELLKEPKPLPENWKTRLKLLAEKGFRHVQRDLQICGANGNTFRVVMRQSPINVLDFSIVLLF